MNNDCIYKTVCKSSCSVACIRYTEMNFLLKSSNIPKSKQTFMTLIPDECDFEAFTKLADIRDDILNFTNCGKNLYIYSNTCGNGKTTWAIKLMLQYFNEIWAGNGLEPRGVFLNVPTFLTKCKAVISNPDSEFDKLRERIITNDLVIWDDIAATKLSDYDYNLLLTYIDQRVVSGKSNIYTGNIQPHKLSNYVGERLSSRICGNEVVKIELKGGDRR